MKKIVLGAVILVIVLAALFGFYEYNLFRSGFKYQETGTSIGNINLTTGNASVLININITNPTDLTAIVSKFKGYIYLNNQRIGDGYLQKSLILQGHTTGTAVIVVDFNYRTILATNTIASFLNSPLSFQGSVDASLMGIPVNNIPVEVQTTIKNILI